MKLLSIVIPVYKVERYIKECLDSIYNQKVDESEFEVIVVNDGSPDKSMDIVSLYKNHTNLTIVSQENQGLSIARNNGFKTSNGEYVWFIDSDDYILDGALSRVITLLKSFQNVEVFSSVLMNFYEYNGTTQIEYNPIKGEVSGSEYLKRKYRQGAVQRFIFKKDFLIKNELCFYPGVLHEDSLFGFMMLYLAKSVFIIDDPIYVYRIRTGGSIMSNISIRTANDLLFIHKQLLLFMEQKVVPSDYIWYQECIYNVIDCIFGFSRQIIGSKEFNNFYNENRLYIREQSRILLSGNNKLYAICMIYSPTLYYKFRFRLGLLKRFIKNRFK